MQASGKQASNVNLQAVKSFLCNICESKYKLHHSLRRHYREKHPDQLCKLVTPLRASKTYPFHCLPCDRNFSDKKNFDYHNRRTHTSEVIVLKPKIFVSCFSCGLEFEKQNYVTHLQQEHGILVESETLELNSMEEFYSWKAVVEKESKENFISERGSFTFGKNKTYYFACHRSGFHKTCSNGRRRPRTKGSKKINGFCPASIKVNYSEETGKCQIKFIKTHIGHSNDLVHFSNKDKSPIVCERDGDFNIDKNSEDDVMVDDFISSSPLPTGIMEGKEALKLEMNAFIDTLKSNDEIQACYKMLYSMKSAIDAIRLQNGEMPVFSCNKKRKSSNKKTVTQTNLIFTKKKTANGYSNSEVHTNTIQRRCKKKENQLKLISHQKYVMY